MGLPLRCTCHRLDGRATWRSQHCNDVSLFAFVECSWLRREPRPLMNRRLCNVCAGSSALRWYGSWSCYCFRVMRACASTLPWSSGSPLVVRRSPPHHRSPTSAMQPAGQDPKAQFSPRAKDSTAPFSQICQSILSNLVAQLAKFRARGGGLGIGHFAVRNPGTPATKFGLLEWRLKYARKAPHVGRFLRVTESLVRPILPRNPNFLPKVSPSYLQNSRFAESASGD